MENLISLVEKHRVEKRLQSQLGPRRGAPQTRQKRTSLAQVCLRPVLKHHPRGAYPRVRAKELAAREFRLPQQKVCEQSADAAAQGQKERRR